MGRKKKKRTEGTVASRRADAMKKRWFCAKRALWSRHKRHLTNLANIDSAPGRARYLASRTSRGALTSFMRTACKALGKNLECCGGATKTALKRTKAKWRGAGRSDRAAQRLMLNGGSVFSHIVQGISDLFSGKWI